VPRTKCGFRQSLSQSTSLGKWCTSYLCSTHFSKACCRSLITSKFLALELPFHSWKSPEISSGEIWTVWQVF
jgi:hypothetical protein